MKKLLTALLIVVGLAWVPNAFAQVKSITITGCSITESVNCVHVTNQKLDVNASLSGAAGGVGYVDEATFTLGSDFYTPIGGIYQTPVTTGALTNGQAGVAQLTANRILMVNLRTAAGVDLSAQLQNIDTYTSRLFTSATNITPGSALATTGFVISSRYVSTPPTFTNGQEGAFQMNSHGAMIVDGSGVVQHIISDSGNVTISNPNASVSNTGGGAPAFATYFGANLGGNLTGITAATRGSEKALSVQIVDASGTQVTTFGGAGGTSSNFGSAFPSLGTAVGAKNPSNNMAPLLVDTNGYLIATLGTTLQAAASLGLNYDSIMAYCGTTTSAPTYSTGTNDPLSCTTTGALRTDLLSINGVALLMGAGNTGTGSLRVTLASDNAPLTIRGANSNQAVYSTAGALLNMTTATTTQIVALSGSTVTYVTGYSIVGNGATATTVKFVGGTGSNCATGQHDLTSGISLTALTNTLGISRGGTGPGVLFKNSAGEEICVTSSGAATVGVDVSYAQF